MKKTAKLPTRSAPSPLLATVNSPLESYHSQYSFPSLEGSLGVPPGTVLSLSPVHRTIMSICFAYGARISEVLNLRVSDRIGADVVLVRGAKGSRSYCIYLPGLDRWLTSLHCKDLPEHIFHVKYHSLWSALTRSGVGRFCVHKKNSRVTHTARYKMATNVFNRLGSIGVTDVLKHRSPRSSSYYL
jgi:integrase